MERLPPIPSPPGTIFREIRVNVVPSLVFAALVTLVVFQWRSYEGPAAIVGEAERRGTLVSSTVPARVTRVLVAPLEQVAAGQAVLMAPATAGGQQHGGGGRGVHAAMVPRDQWGAQRHGYGLAVGVP